MSLFPSLSGADSISEIRGRTIEEQLVAAVSECRLNPSYIYEWIRRALREKVDFRCMKLQTIEFGETIAINSEEQVQQAVQYFSALSQTTSVLSDLNYNEQQSRQFASATSRGVKFVDTFRRHNRLVNLQLYRCRPILPDLFCELVCFLVLQDYFRLKNRPSQWTQKVGPDDEISLLSNNYSTILVKIDSSEIQLGLALAANDNGRPPLSKVCSQPTILNRDMRGLQVMEEPSWNFEYVPKSLVEELFVRLDTNNDNLVSKQDLQRQFYGMHVDLSNEQLDAMMKEARLSRFILVDTDRLRDISLRELYCAVQVHRIRKNGRWLALPRETSKYWRMLFRTVGINFEIQQPKRSQLGRSGTIRIKQLPTQPDYNKRLSEGGLPVGLTQSINTFSSENCKTADDSGKIQTIINGNINKIDGQRTIAFETRCLFEKQTTSNNRRIKQAFR